MGEVMAAYTWSRRRQAPRRTVSGLILPGEPLLRLEAPSARDKGFAAWRPTPGTIEYDILQDLLQQLTVYQNYLPVGPRTLMYRILPAWLIPDPARATQIALRQEAFGRARAYDGGRQWYLNKGKLMKMVGDVLTKARRAGYIPFDSIDDQRTASDVPTTTQSLPGIVANMQVDRQDGQPYRVEVWVETQANVTRLANVCNQYGISVYSGSGSVPVKANHATGLRVLTSAQPTLLLILGDCDPAGLKNIAAALDDDVRAFVHDQGQRLAKRVSDEQLSVETRTWLASLPFIAQAQDPADNWQWVDAQLIVRHLGITPTMAEAQPAAVREFFSDTPADWPLRAVNPASGAIEGYKVELEALPPDELDRLLTDALAEIRDETAYQAALADEPSALADKLEELAWKLRNGT